jgi:hypothetical protein
MQWNQRAPPHRTKPMPTLKKCRQCAKSQRNVGKVFLLGSHPKNMDMSQKFLAIKGWEI